MKRRSAARIGVNSRDPDHRGDVGDNRLLITDQTQGLLSRGSQVRILPGAPFLSQNLRVSPSHRRHPDHFPNSTRPVGRPHRIRVEHRRPWRRWQTAGLRPFATQAGSRSWCARLGRRAPLATRSKSPADLSRSADHGFHRWGLTRGMEFREEPRDPAWLTDLPRAGDVSRWVCRHHPASRRDPGCAVCRDVQLVADLSRRILPNCPPPAHELPSAAVVSLVSSHGIPSAVGICQTGPDQQYDRA